MVVMLASWCPVSNGCARGEKDKIYKKSGGLEMSGCGMAEQALFRFESRPLLTCSFLEI
jgi:hypothetical protein